MRMSRWYRLSGGKCPGSGQDGVNFYSIWERGMTRSLVWFVTNSHHWQGVGEVESYTVSSGEKGFLLVKKKRGGGSHPVFVYYHGVLGGYFAYESLSFLYTFVIIFLFILGFFSFSLLFPVNCFYLKPWSSPFVSPILNSILLHQKGRRNRGVRVQCVVRESLSGSTELGSSFPKPQHRHKQRWGWRHRV